MPFESQYDPTGGMGIVSFIAIYVTANFMGKYPDKVSVHRKMLILCLCFFVFTFKVVFELILQRIGVKLGTSILYHCNTITQLLIAAATFLVFRDLKISPKIEKILKWFSTSVFRAYLFHEYPRIRTRL